MPNVLYWSSADIFHDGDHCQDWAGNWGLVSGHNTRGWWGYHSIISSVQLLEAIIQTVWFTDSISSYRICDYENGDVCCLCDQGWGEETDTGCWQRTMVVTRRSHNILIMSSPPLLICNHSPVNTNLSPVPSSSQLMTILLHSSTSPRGPSSDYFLIAGCSTILHASQLTQ